MVASLYFAQRLELAHNSPADGMTLAIDALDVRVGGRYQATFGMPGEVPYVETGDYREVVPGERLAFDMTISRGGTVLSPTRCTVELVDRAAVLRPDQARRLASTGGRA
jgi:uncharacterized protein YndB with AHSA1/START domain